MAMVEKDVTGKVVEQSLKTIGRLRTRLRERVPYGPTRSYLTSKEARRRLQAVDPAAKSEMIRRVGDEEWARMMQELYG